MVECKDCKHFDGVLCLRTAKRNGSVLEGARKPNKERAGGVLSRTCGTKGKHFEPKEG